MNSPAHPVENDAVEVFCRPPCCFVLTRDGAPASGMKVTLVSPDRWSRVLVIDKDGVVRAPLLGPGRYLLSASVKEEGARELPGGEVMTLHRITTTTFMAP